MDAIKLELETQEIKFESEKIKMNNIMMLAQSAITWPDVGMAAVMLLGTALIAWILTRD